MHIGLMIDKLAAYAAIGVEHFTFWPHPWTLQSVERLAPIVEAAQKMEAGAHTQ